MYLIAMRLKGLLIREDRNPRYSVISLLFL
jgi:hypothetical protein